MRDDREDLAELVASRRGPTAHTHDADREVADRITNAGWVRIDPADSALVTRIAYAICHSQNPGPSDAWNAYHDEWMRDARAVVAALTRGGSS